MSEHPNTALYTALLTAQRNMGPVVKNASNPAFKTKYANLDSVIDAITGPLNDAGLLLVQRFAVDQGGPVLVTEVIHAASGQSLTSTVPVTCKDPADPQKMGGAITYYRRYSLLALLGLAPEDDDGNAAAKPATPAQAHQGGRSGAVPAANDAYQAVLTTAWDLAEAGRPVAAVKDWLNQHRHAMDKEQRKLAMAELAKIEAAYYGATALEERQTAGV